MHKYLFSILFVSVLFSGCPSTRETEKGGKPTPSPPVVEKKPPRPEITLRVASLNLAKHSKKIETKDIERFAASLKHDTIEILMMQGITRYPELKTRSDIVEELSVRSEMRQTFGETVNISGRQQGNAVFSCLPIRSSENTPYDGLRSSGFEAALQAIIDCGVREIVVVSTALPEKSSLEDQMSCAGKLASFNSFYINHPIIITGNLPGSKNIRSMAQYEAAMPLAPEGAPLIWYSGDGSLKLLHSKTENTVFGQMFIADFAIFRQSNP